MDTEKGTTPETRPAAPKSLPIKIPFLILLIIAALMLVGSGFWVGSRKVAPPPLPTPTSEPSPTAEPSPETTVSATKKPTPTSTTTPTAEPTATSTPTPPPPTPTTEPKADLYISEYSFDHPPKQGEAFTVKIGIYNQGNKAAGGFWWEWWATISAPTYACRQRIDSLAAHGGRIVYCTYTYGGWANYTTRAIADADNEVAESNEGNNTYSQNVIPIH